MKIHVSCNFITHELLVRFQTDDETMSRIIQDMGQNLTSATVADLREMGRAVQIALRRADDESSLF